VTTREAIISSLAESDSPLAVFEFGFMGMAQTAISARLRELAREGVVIGVKHPKGAWKVWSLAPGQGNLPL
jgi:DNA-binding HxlR family transcriptional regulator